MIDIKGLDKAKVLKALYDHGHVAVVSDGAVTVERCAELLRTKTSFDYLRGRVIMANLSGDSFDERMYDLNCGAGAAQRAVDSVRAEQEAGNSKKCGRRKERAVHGGKIEADKGCR